MGDNQSLGNLLINHGISQTWVNTNAFQNASDSQLLAFLDVALHSGCCHSPGFDFQELV